MQEQLELAATEKVDGTTGAKKLKTDAEWRVGVGGVVGRFKLIRPLARGGMSKLFVVQDVETGCRFAMKVLRKEYVRDVQVAWYFEQEAQVLAKLSHAGVPQLIEHGRAQDGSPYIVVELLEGESLAERLNADPLSVEECSSIMEQIATILAEAHRAGIVHCDLKPDNIFLVRQSGLSQFPIVKVLDFGVSQVQGAQLPELDENTEWRMVGTPPYMAPEQGRAEGKVDERSDVYALGCLAYEMLCGRPPFVGSVLDMLYCHRALPPIPVSTMRPDVSYDLESLILAMLAKSPDKRPQDMYSVVGSLLQPDLRCAA